MYVRERLFIPLHNTEPLHHCTDEAGKAREERLKILQAAGNSGEETSFLTRLYEERYRDPKHPERTVDNWLSQHPGAMERVIFNVFKDEDKKYYEELIQ